MKKPIYLKSPEDSKLFNELRSRVNARVATISEDRDKLIQFKVFLLPALYFGSYFLALYYREQPAVYIGSFVFMGILFVLIYLNIIHEAAHNNIFKNRKYNRAVLKIFDLVGANSFIWEKRHIVSHHAYPNVDGWDTDIEQSGVFKIVPLGKAKGIQKYQHRFFFLVYPLYLFNWMFIRDFRDFFDKNRVIKKVNTKIPTSEKVKMIFFKAFYFFYQIGIPILFLNVSWKLAILAWILQIVVASSFALFVLLPLHALSDNEFPALDEDHNLPYSWIKHQFEVTNDLQEHKLFVRYVLGNFNYHLAHHLFPNYSYEYYHEITDEIKKFAKEHQFNYKQYSMFKALGMHYQLLKSNATSVKTVMEETM